MRAHEIMTENPSCCTPDTPAREAARLMAEQDCGCIPVVADTASRRLVGVVTDRDLTVRALAVNRSADTPVRELMSDAVSCCAPYDDVETVERIMAERQVRRVPVIDAAGCCVGIVSQADLAREEGFGVSESDVGRVVERISEPAGGPRAERDVGIRVERGDCC